MHAQTVTGALWDRMRREGYAGVFGTLRVPCMNCHAPANVLDLAGGAPVERTDAPDLGVDCVSCHVSKRGIALPGRLQNTAREVVPDIPVALPSPHGEIAAEFRYRDWWALTNADVVIRTLKRTY